MKKNVILGASDKVFVLSVNIGLLVIIEKDYLLFASSLTLANMCSDKTLHFLSQTGIKIHLFEPRRNISNDFKKSWTGNSRPFQCIRG